MRNLLVPREVDEMLRYPRGRSARLARAGRMPAIILPDGSVRFDRDVIIKLLTSVGGEHVVAKVPETNDAR